MREKLAFENKIFSIASKRVKIENFKPHRLSVEKVSYIGIDFD